MSAPSPRPANGPMLSVQGLGKTFGTVAVLQEVGFDLQPGEVHAVIGENGAGKSTLMKILAGHLEPTAGTIAMNGAPIRFTGPVDAERHGIVLVHQEILLAPHLTVAENLFLGREKRRGLAAGFRVDDRAMNARAAEAVRSLGAEIDPAVPVAQLSIAQRQMVEIAKALSLNARIIIMDEPTSSLTIAETQTLLRVVGELKAAGVAIIFITHRLGEIEACADRVVCLRDGRLVGALDRDEIHHDRMVRMMVGRDLRALYIPPGVEAQPDAVEIRGVRTTAYPEQEVTLSVGRGEILGLAGLVGSGRTELARAVFGIDRMLAGEIRLDGTPLTIGSPRAAIAQGLFLVPEDRKRSGLVLDMTIAENVTLPGLRQVAKRWLIDGRGETKEAEAQRERLRIRAPSVTTTALKLSGGNQQKIVLSKWINADPEVLILDEPTRGIDVGAKSEIYGVIDRLAAEGKAVVLISSELPELLGMCDRIATMSAGRLTGVVSREEATQESLMRLMTMARNGNGNGNGVSNGVGVKDGPQDVRPTTTGEKN